MNEQTVTSPAGDVEIIEHHAEPPVVVLLVTTEDGLAHRVVLPVGDWIEVTDVGPEHATVKIEVVNIRSTQ